MGLKSSNDLWMAVLLYMRGKDWFRNKDLLEDTGKDRTAIKRIMNLLVKHGFFKDVKVSSTLYYFKTESLQKPEILEIYEQYRKKDRR